MAVLKAKTLTECYAHFGIQVSYPRRLWSAQAPDGQVVVTLWTDHFSDLQMTKFSIFDRDDLPIWEKRPENHRRTIHLKRVGIGGIFQSIIQKCADTTAHPRKTVERRIGSRMRLIELNETTGEFRAESTQSSAAFND